MVYAAPDIRDGVGSAWNSASIQLVAFIPWFVPHLILGTRLHDLLTWFGTPLDFTSISLSRLHDLHTWFEKPFDFTSISLFLTHLILGTASVRPSFCFYFMVCAAPDIKDEVGLTPVFPSIVVSTAKLNTVRTWFQGHGFIWILNLFHGLCRTWFEGRGCMACSHDSKWHLILHRLHLFWHTWY